MSVEKVDKLVVAACILHNFLTRPGDAECRLQCEGENLQSVNDYPDRGGQEAFAVRDKFVRYLLHKHRPTAGNEISTCRFLLYGILYVFL